MKKNVLFAIVSLFSIASMVNAEVLCVDETLAVKNYKTISLASHVKYVSKTCPEGFKKLATLDQIIKDTIPGGLDSLVTKEQLETKADKEALENVKNALNTTLRKKAFTEDYVPYDTIYRNSIKSPITEEQRLLENCLIPSVGNPDGTRTNVDECWSRGKVAFTQADVAACANGYERTHFYETGYYEFLVTPDASLGTVTVKNGNGKKVKVNLTPLYKILSDKPINKYGSVDNYGNEFTYFDHMFAYNGLDGYERSKKENITMIDALKSWKSVVEEHDMVQVLFCNEIPKTNKLRKKYCADTALLKEIKSDLK